MTPYYKDANVTIWHGDCRDLLERPGIRADLVLADPPYGDTALEWDRWPAGWVHLAAQITSQLWCFGSMRMWLDQIEEFRFKRDGWQYGQEIVWEKHNGSGFATDRFRRVHELAMHWYRGPWSTLTINPQYTTGHDRKVVRSSAAPSHTGAIGPGRGYDTTDRLQRSVIAVHSMNGRAIHPTEKPVGILEPLIRYSTNPGDLILDPFMGSGSTLRAAVLNGRCAVGIEAREEYCEAAVRSLQQGALDFGAAGWGKPA